MYESSAAATTQLKNVDSPSALLSTARSKRVILTMGGKGGVGKTSFMLVLAEWFEAHQIPVTLLDLDTENKSRGSLQHYFDGTVTKVNIHTAAGLDTFVDHLAGALLSSSRTWAQVLDKSLTSGSTACSRMWQLRV